VQWTRAALERRGTRGERPYCLAAVGGRQKINLESAMLMHCLRTGETRTSYYFLTLGNPHILQRTAILFLLHIY
jgi:hypothetical protein